MAKKRTKKNMHNVDIRKNDTNDMIVVLKSSSKKPIKQRNPLQLNAQLNRNMAYVEKNGKAIDKKRDKKELRDIQKKYY